MKDLEDQLDDALKAGDRDDPDPAEGSFWRTSKEVGSMNTRKHYRLDVVAVGVLAKWELYDGKECIGWVEEMYAKAPTWEAACPEGCELGRHRTRNDAEKAVKKHYESESH